MFCIETKDENKFIELLEKQEELNNKFTPGWKDKVPLEKFKIAFITEFAEFLESTPKFYNHKFWKPYLEDDIQNSKVEIIDMLHFALSMIILYRKGKFKFVYPIKPEESKSLKDVLKRYSDFLKKPDYSNLVEFLAPLCDYHNMSFEDLYCGYFLKHDLNVKRVESGYTKGEYQKVDENGVEDNRCLKV